MIIAPKTRQIRILYTILIAGGALLVVLLLRSLFLHKEQLPPALEVGNATEKEWVLSLGSFSIPVTLADSPEEREQGLSGTLSLPKESGLLFLFDKPDFYGFWMKDMAYPLDIVWIDKDFKIIGISKDIAPNSYPQIFLVERDIHVHPREPRCRRRPEASRTARIRWRGSGDFPLPSYGRF